MKKIFFINSRLSNGGSERVMTILANYLAKTGKYEVHMVLVREKQEEFYEVDNKIKVHQLEYKTKNKFIILLKRLLKLHNLFKKENPDAIISFMVDINIITIVSGFFIRNRIIVSERADPQADTRKKFFKILEKILYPRCKKVVLQTNDVKKYYDSINVKNTIVIANPINNNIPEQYNGEREKRIIAAGRLTEQKNFALLINAFKKFIEVHDEYILEICGEGPLKKELMVLAENSGIREKVVFSGFVKNVNERMHNAMIYVSTSNFEGISNSMLEAMAMGVPTICTDCPVGGAKMVIKNNVNGILIPLNDEKALLNAMMKICNDLSFTKQISNQAIRIREEYSIDKIIDKWNKIIRMD